MHDFLALPKGDRLRPIVQGVRDQRLVGGRIIPIDPSRNDVVAFLNVLDVTPRGDHHACRFMAEERRQSLTRSCWPLHGVKLRVTNATGEELDEYLVRRRIGKLNFVHH